MRAARNALRIPWRAPIAHRRERCYRCAHRSRTHVHGLRSCSPQPRRDSGGFLAGVVVAHGSTIPHPPGGRHNESAQRRPQTLRKPSVGEKRGAQPLPMKKENATPRTQRTTLSHAANRHRHRRNRRELAATRRTRRHRDRQPHGHAAVTVSDSHTLSPADRDTGKQ